MHSMILAVVTGASLTVASVGAQAMPAVAIDGAGTVSQITRVADNCGPGFARGPAGVCRRIGRVVVRRPVVVVPRRVRPRCGVRVGPIGVRTPC